MVGPQIAGKLFRFPNLPGQRINPLGPLNSATAGGVILFLIDGVVHAFIGSKYGYSYIRPLIHGIAGGLIGGGIIGGIFDDAEPGLSKNPIVQMGIPSGSSAGNSLAVYAGRQ